MIIKIRSKDIKNITKYIFCLGSNAVKLTIKIIDINNCTYKITYINNINKLYKIKVINNNFNFKVNFFYGSIKFIYSNQLISIEAKLESIYRKLQEIMYNRLCYKFIDTPYGNIDCNHEGDCGNIIFRKNNRIKYSIYTDSFLNDYTYILTHLLRMLEN